MIPAYLEIEKIGRIEDFVLMGFDEGGSQELPTHPVSKGYKIGDGRNPDVDTLEIEMILSGLNIPTPFQGYGLKELARALQSMPALDAPYLERFELMKRAKNEGLSILVITERGAYDGYYIKSYRSPIEKDLALSARISFSLEKIPIANTESVVVPEVQIGAKAQLQFGKDATPTRNGPKGSKGRVTPIPWGSGSSTETFSNGTGFTKLDNLKGIIEK